MQAENGVKTEVRLHGREIEKMREKLHNNSNVLQKHEDRLERLEEGAEQDRKRLEIAASQKRDERQFNTGVLVAIASSVLGSATAIILALAR